jgi:hypothetical protein
MSQIYYLIRSRTDGQYLVARPKTEAADSGYVLMFREQFDALSYLNTHGKGVADRFAVESIPATQMKALLDRWGFTGIGMVQDPLVPQIEFLTHR